MYGAGSEGASRAECGRPWREKGAAEGCRTGKDRPSQQLGDNPDGSALACR